MKPKQLMAAVRADWWLPLIGLIVAGGVALVVSLLQTPLYVSSTQFFISTTDSTSASPSFQGSQFSVQRAVAYARLINGEEMSRRVIDRLGLDMSTGELQSTIQASAVPDTVLVDVTVTDSSAERAKRIADAVGTEFIDLINELEAPANGAASPVTATITDRPEAAGEPSSPDTLLNVATAGLLGLLVGGGIAVARRRPDRWVASDEQGAELAGAPVVGHVLRDGSLAKRHLMHRGGSVTAAENFRQLRNNLQRLDGGEPPRVIMVTSAVPSEGKTTAVVNLALVLAEAGHKVTVLDAHLRAPRVAEYLGIPNDVGLSDLLTGGADFDDVLRRYSERDLWVIPAGPIPVDAGQLLASSDLQAIVAKLSGDSDYVLVDAPPVLPVADASGLAVHVDGVLICVRYGSTRTAQLRQAAAVLDRARARTLGVVLTVVPPKADVTGRSKDG
jgi:receptor protein-tyrosine kinase